MKKNPPPSLKKRIYTQLRDDIVYGRILPGEHLRETWLTEKFQCSRGPVREALNQMEREGFLTLIPHRGALVQKFSPEEVRDFYALLELLEGRAVEWSTPCLGPEDFLRLEEINSQLAQIARSQRDSIEDWVAFNLSFHGLFREKCGNQKMSWIIDEVRLRISRYRYTSLIVTAYDEYVKDHERIIEAVRKRDATGAGKAMERHIRRAKDILMDFLSRFPAL